MHTHTHYLHRWAHTVARVYTYIHPDQSENMLCVCVCMSSIYIFMFDIRPKFSLHLYALNANNYYLNQDKRKRAIEGYIKEKENDRKKNTMEIFLTYSVAVWNFVFFFAKAKLAPIWTKYTSLNSISNHIKRKHLFVFFYYLSNIKL